MRKLLTAVIVASVVAYFIPPARSAEVFKTKNDDGSPIVFRLSNDPCAHPAVMGHIAAKAPPHLRDKFRASTLTWSGKVYQNCYIEYGGYVHSVDEAGDILQPIPKALFREDTI